MTNKFTNRIYSQYKARAKKRNIPFILTKEDIYDLVTSECIYCGSKESNTLKYANTTFGYNGIDRIDSGLPYQWDNCVPSCKGCNSLKGPMKKDQWFSFLQGVVSRSKTKPFWLDINVEDTHDGKSYYRY